jgi:hypothetical protein
MSKREDYELILSDLKSSQNEEDVITNITKIIKGFTSDYYKNDLYENPYFKSFIPEIKENISTELSKIKSTINEEIKAIDGEILKLNQQCITSINNTDYSKLRQLKKECLILIKELDNRLQDLLSL